MSRPSRKLPLALGLVSAGALGLVAVSARSQSPSSAAPAPSASAGAVASASAVPFASAAKPGPPILKAADIPAEKSKAPEDKKEWEAAREISPNDGAGSPCVFKLLREWLRVECPTRIGVALIAGETEDTKTWAWGDPFQGLPSADPHRGPAPQAVIVMPLRRGEAKMFDLVRISDGGWDWVGPSTAERISVTWREGGDPMILVAGTTP